MKPPKDLKKLFDIPLESNSVAIHGLNIHYVVVGSGNPVLLLHGANIGLAQWYVNIKQLSKHFKIVAIDLPGSGYSSKIDYKTMDLEKDFIDITKKFISILKLKHVSIVGHSIGASIAVKISKDKNMNILKLVLIDPIGLTREIPFNYKVTAIYPLVNLISKTVLKPNKKNLEAFLKSVVVNKESISDNFVDYYHKSVNREKINHPLLLMNSLTRNFFIKKELMIDHDLETSQIPVLLIIGDKDPLIPFINIREELNNLLQKNNITIKIIENAGHVVSIEKSDTFNKMVINFLK